VVYVSESLDSRHDASGFHSDQPELDRWLANHSLTAEARRAARTFVWHAGDNRVVAYYSIAAHLIVRADLPRNLARGNPYQIPAVLLARLALDQSLHGQKLGGALLAEALGRIVAATEIIAARYVVVDALDENAAHFYEHHGFRAVPGGRRLVQKVSDVAAGLADVRWTR
jgi:GNAT superfamily N-acetyltransferase